ncbi:hypothetical protein, partial [Tepidanaerobacter syntrophicus]|uniref:hypothetical protein n=1 Tax=Tepidanaerobacter syntrophicus TaxID=224999 RepID=UPI00235647CE
MVESLCDQKLIKEGPNKSSSNVTNGELSKQTVKNKIHSLKLEALKTKVPKKRGVEVLHIDAD